MKNDQNQQRAKPFRLEERNVLFAADVRALLKRLPSTIANHEDIRQLVRSSGSVGANFIEAHEAIGTKDCLKNMKISRREAKESMFWLSLIDTGNNQTLESERQRLKSEATELVKILSDMINEYSERTS